MKYIYTPKGVCSVKMIFEFNNETIKSLEIIGGCPGNTIGISKLVEGRLIDDVIEILKGIPCGIKGTSCPDQVAQALKEYKNRQ